MASYNHPGSEPIADYPTLVENLREIQETSSRLLSCSGELEDILFGSEKLEMKAAGPAKVQNCFEGLISESLATVRGAHDILDSIISRLGRRKTPASCSTERGR
jgi:hypothetical protein